MNESLITSLKESTKARLNLASKDIGYFAEYYLSRYIKTPTDEGIHFQWIKDIRSGENMVIAAPRGHGKSTWFSLVYPLWCTLFQHKKFITIISDTHTQAGSLLQSIISELETNIDIINDFGSIAGYIPDSLKDKTKWTVHDIETTTGVRIIALGSNAKFRGIRHRETRPDLIVIDDIENDENVQSPDQRVKLDKLFRNNILNLGDDQTRFIMVGTILHYDSLLSNLIKTPPPKWNSKIYRAIDENGLPLWASYWTLERLEQKKNEIGSIAFEQEYMNNPLDKSAQIINPKAFYEIFDQASCNFYGYIDLAISEKETADYTAIVTVARDKVDGKIYVVDPVKIRGNVQAQLDLVYEQYRKYPYKVFGVESVQYQKAFLQWLLQDSQKRGIYIPAIEIEIDKDKVRRTLEITPYIDNGTIMFNNNYVDFMAELMQFPKASHDDFVDAFTGAVKLALSGTTSGQIVSRKGINYPK